MIILDGKKTSNDIKQEIYEEVKLIIAKGLRPPHLAAVIVGNDGASLTYVGSKVKACNRVGFDSSLIRLPNKTTQNQLLEKVEELNNDTAIDGYIVQLPLPQHIDSHTILMAIDPDKDVDGFHPSNFGKMALNLPTFISATPHGIMELLKRYKVPTEGKQTIVIGRSDIVGKPISILMGLKTNPGNSTVTLAHSRTADINSLTLGSDIIISALGIPNFLKADMVKDTAVVIDVGITRVKDNSEKGYKIVGDVDYENVSKKCSFITPVPGGVGPMTIAMLLKNCLFAYNNR
ncbi:MAG: bifunctional 5,10-methylene-tetrahydrofolate dehydrogenase/5,10-methylene-tetrahydrofolate cyclohydrolase [Flavobacteriales bacterium]|nr:bifunctional 5,10-methylene-tetrahydrofolate dehydrogenase/5,10-methylene-tetrahydrofolate cyclohydrolase [Flavobacteriales bacterium]|tara:strand:+ start:345 stop:1214 length:870 start_codon:yes stop_codon:yes gene_type:complete